MTQYVGIRNPITGVSTNLDQLTTLALVDGFPCPLRRECQFEYVDLTIYAILFVIISWIPFINLAAHFFALGDPKALQPLRGMLAKVCRHLKAPVLSASKMPNLSH